MAWANTHKTQPTPETTQTNTMKTLPLITATCLALASIKSAPAADEKKHAEHSMPSPMSTMIADKSGADFEAAYLGLMTLHHEGGAPMWALLREKSKNEELLALEKKTTAKEQKEIEQMTAWLKEWHGKTPQDFSEPEESKKMMAMDMAELKAAAGKEFDALFAKKMAHHHMGAIEMGKLASEKAQHAEVKASGKTIVESQTADRKKLLSISEETN